MHGCKFFGDATVGSKGQIVIPSEAREALGIKPGDKLVIIGMKDRQMLGIIPAKRLDTILTELTEKLSGLRQIIDKKKG